MKQSQKLAKEGEGDLLKGLVSGIGDGLKFGAKLLKDTVGKAGLQLSKLEKQFFALKNGILYWYVHERARKAQGSIIVKNIEAMEILAKNPL